MKQVMCKLSAANLSTSRHNYYSFYLF